MHFSFKSLAIRNNFSLEAFSDRFSAYVSLGTEESVEWLQFYRILGGLSQHLFCTGRLFLGEALFQSFVTLRFTLDNLMSGWLFVTVPGTKTKETRNNCASTPALKESLLPLIRNMSAHRQRQRHTGGQ
jgi:hypothetical protein